MRRLLPHPVMSIALLLLWLLLNQTTAPGAVLVGVVLALLGGWALSLPRPDRVRIRRIDLILRLLAMVVIDVARSNLAVARVILDGRRRDRRAGFIQIPLRLRDPLALAILATILTATPGSAFVEFDTTNGMLLLHVLDLVDEAEWVQIVSDRYEGPLMEIFQ